jgi:hypothetical protein
MTRNEAYEAMQTVLRDVLPDIEVIARSAKNVAARRAAQARVLQIREVLKAAEEAPDESQDN